VLIDWFTIVAQIINFVILVLLLRRFLYRPIVRAMEEREAKIASQVQEAERREREAEEEAKTWRLKNQELEELRDEMLHEAGQEAEKWRRDLIREAREEVADTRARWEQAIEEEQEAFLQELRQRTMRQVHNIARRALADLANTELEAHLADVFIRRLHDDGHEDVARALREAREPLIIRTAFPSPPELRHKLREAIVGRVDNDIELEFETAPHLVCGIELMADDYRIAWSLDDYLGSLEQDLIRALEEEASVNGSEGTDNGSG
jgi:F-type H+-transporting ATPase subunit b